MIDDMKGECIGNCCIVENGMIVDNMGFRLILRKNANLVFESEIRDKDTYAVLSVEM